MAVEPGIDRPPGQGRRALLLVVAITLGVMFPVCLNQFVLWDDQLSVACNAQLAPMTWESFRYWWAGPVWGWYTPVLFTVWGLVSVAAHVPPDPLTGIAQIPFYFHAANLIAHLFATVAVFKILMLLVRRPWPAAAGALLFGIHPLQVETVAWVNAFNGGLCASLSLWAVWHYLRFAQIGGRRRYGLVCLLLLLAMLTKPLAMVVPPIAAALDLLLLRRPLRRVLSAVVPLLLPGIVVAVILVRTQPPPRFGPTYTALDRFMVVSDSLVFYSHKLVWPGALAINHNHTVKEVTQSNWALSPRTVRRWIFKRPGSVGDVRPKAGPMLH